MASAGGCAGAREALKNQESPDVWRRPGFLRGCVLGGGGGNRTRVRECSTRSVYRLRSSTIVISGFAPDQATFDQLTCFSRTLRGERRQMPA